MKERGELNETQLLFYGDKKPAEELYDLDSDPHEIRNLALDPALAETLKQHRQLLDNWIRRTGDQGQQPESIDGLTQVYYEWGEQCVNPEYAAVKKLGIQPKPNPARDKAAAKAAQLLRDAIQAPIKPIIP
jgi:hypothetical protein